MASTTWRKIAIVGCHPEYDHLAPFNDRTWEIWGFSRRNFKKLPKCDKWFELHDKKHFPRYEDELPGYNEFLKRGHVVLAEDFPKQSLVDRFGSFFFSGGQLPYLMAHAITLKPEAIGLWGVECIDKYAPQKTEVQHFAQVCHDSGIKTVVPEGCTILQARPSYL